MVSSSFANLISQEGEGFITLQVPEPCKSAFSVFYPSELI